MYFPKMLITVFLQMQEILLKALLENVEHSLHFMNICKKRSIHINLISTPVCQIENLQEQLRDKEKQMSSLRERVKSLQTDTSNTDTALTTLEDSLAEKVSITSRGRYTTGLQDQSLVHFQMASAWSYLGVEMSVLSYKHLMFVVYAFFLAPC